MIKEITMPAGGQTTDTSAIGAWLVKKGDKINRGDALLEIETDKATLTVESFARGTVLAILAEAGDELPAGTVIALVGDENDIEEAEKRINSSSCSHDGGAADGEDEEDEYQPIDRSAPVGCVKEAAGQTDIKAMPNAKKIAKENGISLADVAQYTGKDILKRRDVNAYIEHLKKISAKTTVLEETEDVVVPLTTMRKVIARRMLESAQNIPVFTVAVEVEMDQCIAFRKRVNTLGDSMKISYNDILFKCVEAAIRKYPYVNSSYTDDAIILHKNANIGLAVSVENGLVVPVVKQTNKKNIAEISRINRENIEKARSGKLTEEDISGGTITVSNLGMYPVTQFNAIINPPEVCILAIAAIEDKPAIIKGEWKMIPVMKITGSFDHRVVDGAYGALFLTELKKIIENPALALL